MVLFASVLNELGSPHLLQQCLCVTFQALFLASSVLPVSHNPKPNTPYKVEHPSKSSLDAVNFWHLCYMCLYFQCVLSCPVFFFF